MEGLRKIKKSKAGIEEDIMLSTPSYLDSDLSSSRPGMATRVATPSSAGGCGGVESAGHRLFSRGYSMRRSSRKEGLLLGSCDGHCEQTSLLYPYTYLCLSCLCRTVPGITAAL
jgi:hypothetical protein